MLRGTGLPADSSRRATSHLRVVSPDAGAPPSGPTPSDQDIIEAVARGDNRTAGLLYDRLIGTVDRTLYRIFGRREADHDDLVQATFEQIVLTLSRRRFAGACSLSTWASKVATHVGLNALRSRRRERRIVDRSEAAADAASVAPPSRDFARDAGARMELERLRRVLSEMDAAKAETVFLHDALGHELAEIAVLMGVSVAAAQSRLVRGRRELAERIARDEREGKGGGS